LTDCHPEKNGTG